MGRGFPYGRKCPLAPLCKIPFLNLVGNTPRGMGSVRLIPALQQRIQARPAGSRTGRAPAGRFRVGKAMVPNCLVRCNYPGAPAHSLPRSPLSHWRLCPEGKGEIVSKRWFRRSVPGRTIGNFSDRVMIGTALPHKESGTWRYARLRSVRVLRVCMTAYCREVGSIPANNPLGLLHPRDPQNDPALHQCMLID